MEYRDIYNENMERTGKIISSDTPLLPGERILCAGCWVINSAREIFLTKRSPEKRFMPDKWENSGGHAFAGEDGKTCAVRELYEETGIRACVDDLILLSRRMTENTIAEDFALIADFPIEDVVLQPGETCDAKWVSEDVWESMLQTGEIAPSVNEALVPFKQKLLDILHGYPAADR